MSVWPTSRLLVNDGNSLVKPGPFLPFHATPLTVFHPVPQNLSDSPLVRIHRDGPWLAQLGGYQHFPLPAVTRGDGDALVARVGPVDVLVDPVDSQALGGVERVDERHLFRRVTGLVDVRAGGWSRQERQRTNPSARFGADTFVSVYSGFLFS